MATVRYQGAFPAVDLLVRGRGLLRVGRGETAEVPDPVALELARRGDWDVTGVESDGSDDGDELDLIEGLKDEQRVALRAAGYGDLAALRDASDEQLGEVPTIGPAAIRTIRQALGQEPDPEE